MHLNWSKCILARVWQKVPYSCDNQNLVDFISAKDDLLRAFPENLKQLSLISTNIWRLEATYVIRFEADVRKVVNSNMTSECWSAVACSQLVIYVSV